MAEKKTVEVLTAEIAGVHERVVTLKAEADEASRVADRARHSLHAETDRLRNLRVQLDAALNVVCPPEPKAHAVG